MLVILLLLVSSLCAAGEVQLTGTTDLWGVVADAQGNPIAGAEVLLYAAQPRVGPHTYCPSCYPDCGKHVTTDAQGRFSLKSVADWLTFQVYAAREGYEPDIVADVDPGKGFVRIVLKKPSAEYAGRHVVEGRILDPDGKPIAGATVRPFGRKLGEDGVVCGLIIGNQPIAITDQQGVYRFHPKNHGQEIYADLSARGLADRRFVIDESPGAHNETRMSTGTTVNGSLLDKQGKSLAGIDVAASWSDGSHSCVGNKSLSLATDTEGHFSIDNVPAHTAIGVYARMSSLAPLRQVTDTINLTTAGENTRVATEMRTAPEVFLRGQIALADGAAVPPNSRIALRRGETDDVVFSNVDASGSFVFHGILATSEFQLVPIVKGYQTSSALPIDASAALRVAGNLGDTKPIRIELVPVRPDARARASYAPGTE